MEVHQCGVGAGGVRKGFSVTERIQPITRNIYKRKQHSGKDVHGICNVGESGTSPEE